MSLQSQDLDYERVCFPRVSGDEPDLLRAAAALRGFSPRERG